MSLVSLGTDRVGKNAPGGSLCGPLCGRRVQLRFTSRLCVFVRQEVAGVPRWLASLLGVQYGRLIWIRPCPPQFPNDPKPYLPQHWAATIILTGLNFQIRNFPCSVIRTCH